MGWDTSKQTLRGELSHVRAVRYNCIVSLEILF